MPVTLVEPASRADLVRADLLKAQDGYSLERSSRIGGRSRIEGAIPAERVGGQDATPEPVSVEHDFTGGEREPVEEDFAGGEPEPSAEDFRDGLAEQGMAGGHEHQVKNDQYQAFISGLIESALEEPRFPSSSFFLEQRPDPTSSFHQASTLFRKICQSPWSHTP